MEWVNAFVGKAPPEAFRLPQLDSTQLRPQEIPRIIVQSVPSRADGQWMRKYFRLMQSWRHLNPEYLYLLLDDRDCRDFVMEHASTHEKLAYHTVLTGAQRADLFRVFFLRTVGGIWADTDTEIRTPLHRFIPANASAVASIEWDFSFLAYAPNHPVLRLMAKKATEETLYQASAKEVRNPWACQQAFACVLAVTGPPACSQAASAPNAGMMSRLRPRP